MITGTKAAYASRCGGFAREPPARLPNQFNLQLISELQAISAAFANGREVLV